MESKSFDQPLIVLRRVQNIATFGRGNLFRGLQGRAGQDEAEGRHQVHEVALREDRAGAELARNKGTSAFVSPSTHNLADRSNLVSAEI